MSALMTAHVDFQNALDAAAYDALPWSQWANATRQHLGIESPCEVTIRLVDAAESHTLNAAYRGKAAPTNVLSFPADLDLPLDIPLLGDLVICLPVVQAEAQDQQKTETAHLAHLTIHGLLHLHGYDHETDADASDMETLEIGILEKLGYANPYLSEEDPPT
jgi:probable rRNA maturation factor